MVIAALNTSATTLRWALLFIAHHPDVQHKVHCEIDAHIGTERALTYADRSQLPYVETVLQEVLRFATTAPTVNRRAVRDFRLGAYEVRADTTIAMNLYGIFRDPRVWSDPTHFNPDANFPLGASKKHDAVDYLCPIGVGKRVCVGTGSQLYPFGIGKRVCPGETLARQELFLLFAGLMLVFRVAADPSVPLPPEDVGTPGITRGPLPFKVQFISRSKESKYE